MSERCEAKAGGRPREQGEAKERRLRPRAIVAADSLACRTSNCHGKAVT